MRLFSLIAVSFLLISLASVSYSQIPTLEREALIAFYNATYDATNANSWLNPLGSIPLNSNNPGHQAYLISMLWKTTDWQKGRTDDDVFREAGTECDWYGVTCTNGHVTSLAMSNHLSGPLPAELGNLTQLTELSLYNNSITGVIPTELGNLTNLTTLNLYDNDLIGSIPAELGNLTNLEYLDLSHNSLSGSIPAELGNLTNLTVLFLNRNASCTANRYGSCWYGGLSGSIPVELGNLTNLTHLYLSTNQLSGSIPSELGNLTNLTHLLLSTNFLTGPTPQWILNRSWTNLDLTNAFQVTPSVAIVGGNRTIADTDGAAGESVSFTGTATDSDGTITATEWYVGDSLVATGLTATIALSEGATVVTFKATDNDRASTSATATITVEAPNVSPSVSISGGNRTIADTDNIAGESVGFTGAATDSDGTIATTQWLVGGSVVGTGLSTTIALSNGATVVTFKATDNDGDSSTTTATITVEPHIVPPTVSISGGDRTIVESDGNPGESVSFTGTATDSDGTVVSTEWLVGGLLVGTGLTPSISLPNGSTVVTFRATDNEGGTASTSATITVGIPAKVTGLEATDGEDSNKVWLSYNASIGATEYKIYDATSETGTRRYLGTCSQAGHKLCWVYNVPTNIIYYYFVVPSNNFGDGESNFDTGYTNKKPEVIANYFTDSLSWKNIVEGSYYSIADTDEEAGESVSFSGSATDSDTDGIIVTVEWLVGDTVVATGYSPTLSLPDGSTVVTFKATDNFGGSSSVSFTMNVEAPPNNAPSVAISGGNRTIADTDNIAGESVGFTGTATDSDGTIATTEWLVGGSVVATGLTPAILLMNGSTVVTFKATDNDGDSSTTTVTITVNAPDYVPAEEWPFPYNGVTPEQSLLEESAFAQGHFLLTPDSATGLAPNNIGIYNSDDSTIYTCLRVYTDGLPGSVGGIGEFDIGFTVFSLEEGTVQVSRFREFNEIGALNEYSERPDCSGKLETTTGIYTDIIHSGTNVLATTWSLIDPDNLILKLESYETLSH